MIGLLPDQFHIVTNECKKFRIELIIVFNKIFLLVSSFISS